MTSLSLQGLLNVAVNLESSETNTSVRKRLKPSSSKRVEEVAVHNQDSDMVPKIAVVSHATEDLCDEEDERRHFLNPCLEEEDLSDELRVNRGTKQDEYRENDGGHVLIGGFHSPYMDSDLAPLLEAHKDDGLGTGLAERRESGSEEGSFTIGLQVFFPFLVAGFGTVLAGLLLDVVQVKRIDITFTYYDERKCNIRQFDVWIALISSDRYYLFFKTGTSWNYIHWGRKLLGLGLLRLALFSHFRPLDVMRGIFLFFFFFFHKLCLHMRVHKAAFKRNWTRVISQSLSQGLQSCQVHTVLCDHFWLLALFSEELARIRWLLFISSCWLWWGSPWVLGNKGTLAKCGREQVNNLPYF